MAIKLISAVLALCVTVSYGAVIPAEEDVLFEMLQSFLAQPDEFATALGMTRVKRDASYDKSFNFPGGFVGLDYTDPNNKLKGGKMDITIDNLKAMIPKAKSEKVKLSVNFNGGDNAKDGLFTMSIDYELNHVNKEEGTFNMERTKSGANWVTKVSVKSKNNPAVKIIPAFDMDMKSDRNTFLDGNIKCEHGHVYKIDVKRVPGKKMDAIIEGAGQTYIINGVRDSANKKITIDIDANGVKKVVELSMAGTDDKQVVANGKLNMGASGVYEVKVNAQRDMTDAKLDVLMSGNTLLHASLKGKIDNAKKSAKYEVRYNAVGLGDGKIRLGLKSSPDMELMFQYMPKNKPDLKLMISRSKDAKNVIVWKGLATRNGEEYLNYNNKIVPSHDATSYNLNMESKFTINDKSILYPMFCQYGCFNERSAQATVKVLKAKPYKLKLNVHLFKDAAEVLTLDVNTIENPYIFKIVAPRILPKILPTGRESIEFKADHNPGSYLKITSNTNSLKSFSVIKVAGTEDRRIELNGKELVTAGFSKTGNQISNTVKLPNGKSLTTTVSWKTEDVHANKVTVKLDGTERQLDLTAEWNFKNPAAMTFDVNAKGKNNRIGAYSFNRKGSISATSGKLSGGWKGKTAAAQTPWPSPVDTDVSFDLNTNTDNYVFNINKTAAGRKMGISYNNGKFSIDF